MQNKSGNGGVLIFVLLVIAIVEDTGLRQAFPYMARPADGPPPAVTHYEAATPPASIDTPPPASIDTPPPASIDTSPQVAATQNEVQQANSQQCGNLLVELVSIEMVNATTATVTLSLKNLDVNHTIGFAAYTDSNFPNNPIDSSLTGGDGQQFLLPAFNIHGINAMNSNPRQLTSLGPGAETQATYAFPVYHVLPNSLDSYIFKSTIIVNGDFNESDYHFYRPVHGILPANCYQYHLRLSTPIAAK